MGLWIRSQDKECLIKINIVEMEYFEEDCFVSINTRFDGKNASLGIYKTKKRALEVLDEIQKLLQPQMVLSKVDKPIAETCDGTVYVIPNEYEIKELSTYVYEMPEE